MFSSNSNQMKRSFDFSDSPSSGMEGKKRKKSRWGGGDSEKTIIPGMPTVLPNTMTDEQRQQYILHLQIEEISRKLRTGDLGIPVNPEERSPSPEPIYNNEGKRLNTREYRTRKKLEEDRHKLVQEALQINSEYKPPLDYKPPMQRVNDKVMIPQDMHPEINFVGLLIGPRGNTLKNLEKDTGAKIIIRGKGSVKEGKIGRKDGQPLPGEDEPLHAYVTGSNPENVQKAVEKIKEIIQQGIEVPEGQNDLRRQQLRELALLNGTLRENDGLMKLKQLQQAQTIVTNTIICTICGGTGHIAQDCKEKRPGDTYRQQERIIQTPSDKAKMDSEYMSLMAELGEGPEPSSKSDSMQPQPPRHGHHGDRFQSQQNFQQRQGFHPPPNPMGVDPPWQNNSNNMRQQGQGHGHGGGGGHQQGGFHGNQQHGGYQQHNQHGGNQGGHGGGPSHQGGGPQHGGGPGGYQGGSQGHQQYGGRQQHGGDQRGGNQYGGGNRMNNQNSSQNNQQQSSYNPGPVAAPWNPPFTPVSHNTGNRQNQGPGGVQPPPPPPNSQSSGGNTAPWLQQQSQSSFSPVAPPPPSTSSGMAPWQNSGMQQQSNNVPPWQVQQSQQQQQHSAPPPPPPSQQHGGYNNMGSAPPPPPPGGYDNNSNRMMVLPPPPPPN